MAPRVLVLPILALWLPHKTLFEYLSTNVVTRLLYSGSPHIMQLNILICFEIILINQDEFRVRFISH